MKQIIIEVSSDEVYLKSYSSGELISLESLQVSESLLQRIKAWIQNYKEANRDESIQYQTIDSLDKEGVNIALSILHELPGLNII